MTKTTTLADIFTEEELDRIKEIHETVPDHEFAKKVADEVITPVLPRINARLGQENDARYLAYACLNAFNQMKQANGGGGAGFKP